MAQPPHDPPQEQDPFPFFRLWISRMITTTKSAAITPTISQLSQVIKAPPWVLRSNFDLSVCLRFESGMIEPPSGREVARLAVTEGARGTNTENSHIKAHKVKSRRLLHPSSTGAPSRREPLLAYFFHPLCRHNTLINPNLPLSNFDLSVGYERGQNLLYRRFRHLQELLLHGYC